MFPTDNMTLGAPVYGMRKGHLGIVFHTDEGNFENSIVGAERLATWQASSRNTSGGSYNFIVTKEGVVLSVPYLMASGGVYGGREPSIWAPEPQLLANFGPEVTNAPGPNAYFLNVCMIGKTSFYEANGWPDEMIDLAAQLIIWLEDAEWGADDAFLSNHEDWQLNRYDPGQTLLPLLMERYVAIRTGSEPVPPAAPIPPSEEETLAISVQRLRLAIPAAYEEWKRNTGITQAIDGTPVTREQRLAAEVTVLRIGFGRVTAAAWREAARDIVDGQPWTRLNRVRIENLFLTLAHG